MAMHRRRKTEPERVEDLLAGLEREEAPSPYAVRELVQLHRAAIRTMLAQRDVIQKLGRASSPSRGKKP